MRTRELTGKHVLILFVGAFGTIIVVNIVLAVSAVTTFPGLEVANSYIASQEFNSRRAAQQSLGWSVQAEAKDGKIYVAFTHSDGTTPVTLTDLKAVIGRPTHTRDDVIPEFVSDGTTYVAPINLERGTWHIHLSARAQNGVEFTQRLQLFIRG